MSELQIDTLHLRVGQEITAAERDEILKSSASIKTYNRALYYLQYGPRTTSQMREYLLKKKYEEEHIEPVLVMLQKERYLNDELLAQTFVQDRQMFKPRSRRMLVMELRKKGVDKNVIDATLDELGDDDQVLAIQSIVAKKIKQSRYRNKTKLTQYLMRQGFVYADVKTVLEELVFDEDISNDHSY